MRNAIVILSLIAASSAEAPYHLLRPDVHAPSFNYHAAPASPPPPPPSHAILAHLAPLPHLPHPQPPPQPFNPQPAPQHSFGSSQGYKYPQPNISPAPIQTPQQQIQSYPQIHVQTHYQTAVSQPQIAYYPSQPSAVQPLPAPYNPQQLYQQPSTSYGHPHPQLQPQPQSHYPPIQYPQSSFEPIRPLPAFIAPQQQAPAQYTQPQLSFNQPISYSQASQTQDYSYQNQQAASLTAQLPLQPLTNNIHSSSLSSYQADSNQYNTAAQSQTHSEALDSTVVNRVQNIIKENEHSSARDAGFLSLVSGVSLENARPSIEISSFVQKSPLTTSSGSLSASSTSSSSSAAVSAPSGGYGLPSINNNNQIGSGGLNLNFLPHTKPAISYGLPK